MESWEHSLNVRLLILVANKGRQGVLFNLPKSTASIPTTPRDSTNTSLCDGVEWSLKAHDVRRGTRGAGRNSQIACILWLKDKFFTLTTSLLELRVHETFYIEEISLKSFQFLSLVIASNFGALSNT